MLVGSSMTSNSGLWPKRSCRISMELSDCSQLYSPPIPSTASCCGQIMANIKKPASFATRKLGRCKLSMSCTTQSSGTCILNPSSVFWNVPFWITDGILGSSCALAIPELGPKRRTTVANAAARTIIFISTTYKRDGDHLIAFRIIYTSQSHIRLWINIPYWLELIPAVWV
jgi:hypothetical protein